MSTTRHFVADMRSRAARVLAAALAAALPLCAATAFAQSPTLAELAKKEQERRKTQKTPAKVYTKKDLPPPSPAAAGGSAQQPAQPPAAEAKPAEPKPAGEEKDETWWKNRINEAREDVRRNEMFAEALQTRINSLSTDFVNRDDPYQRARIGLDRDKAIAELARVKADVETGKKKIEDIEEEARKAGVPPGWLR
jgi:hypothetical protein